MFSRVTILLAILLILSACISIDNSVDVQAPSPTPADNLLSAPSDEGELIPTLVPTSTPTDQLLFLDSEMLVELVQRVRPSIVKVHQSGGTGSGVIFEVDGTTAYILTNEHVISEANAISVVVNDRRNYTATTVGKDKLRDLAVLRICCASDFQSLPLGNAAKLQVGLQVVNIGYALNLPGEATVTTGIISALRYEPREQRWAVQTDAAMNPGNSGGPMLSTEGEILGINTYRIDTNSGGRDAEGLGFAVSIETISERLDDLKGDVSAIPTLIPTPRPTWTPTPLPTPRPTWTPTPIATPTPVCTTFEECMALLDLTLTPNPVATPTPTQAPIPTPVPGQTSGYLGPWDVELVHDETNGFVEHYFAEVYLADIEVSATFHNPFDYWPWGGDWDYGFGIRDDIGLPQLVFLLQGSGVWKVIRDDRHNSGGTDVLDEGRLFTLGTAKNATNHLRVVALGNKAEFFINGNLVSTVGVPRVVHAGDVYVMIGSYAGNERDGAITRVTDWRVIDRSTDG